MSPKPRHFQRPRLAGYEFWACQLPTLAGVGDILVAQPIPATSYPSSGPHPTRWAFAVGEVCGRGETAFSRKAALEDAVADLTRTGPEPTSILERLNRHLLDPNFEFFATLLMATLDGERHEANLANAGCVAQLIRRTDGSVEYLCDEVSGFPLGIDADQTYPPVTVPIGPGDVMVLLSDGISSVMDSGYVLFDQGRLRQAIAQAPGQAASVGQAILRAVRQFASSRPQIDDITLLCIGRVAPSPD